MDNNERHQNYRTERPTPRDDWYLYDGLGTMIGVVAVKSDAERIVDALNNTARLQAIEAAASDVAKNWFTDKRGVEWSIDNLVKALEHA